MILFGLVAAVNGPGYRIGTVMHMGPGFMPTALGVILICLGVVIAGTAIGVPPGEDEDILPEHPQWLGWACILAGPLMFIIFGTFGFIPATFACVFVSALRRQADFLRAVRRSKRLHGRWAVPPHTAHSASAPTLSPPPLLISSSLRTCVIIGSISIFPFMYQSTIFGTSVRPRAPPNAVPFQTRPVTSWNGRVEISFPLPPRR